METLTKTHPINAASVPVLATCLASAKDALPGFTQVHFFEVEGALIALTTDRFRATIAGLSGREIDADLFRANADYLGAIDGREFVKAVKDLGADKYGQGARLEFHTDRADLVKIDRSQSFRLSDANGANLWKALRGIVADSLGCSGSVSAINFNGVYLAELTKAHAARSKALDGRRGEAKAVTVKFGEDGLAPALIFVEGLRDVVSLLMPVRAGK